MYRNVKDHPDSLIYIAHGLNGNVMTLISMSLQADAVVTKYMVTMVHLRYAVVSSEVLS